MENNLDLRYYKLIELWVKAKFLDEKKDPSSAIILSVYPGDWIEFYDFLQTECKDSLELISRHRIFKGLPNLTENEIISLREYSKMIISNLGQIEHQKSFRNLIAKLTHSYITLFYKNGNVIYVILIALLFYVLHKVEWLVLGLFVLRYFLEGTVKGRIMLSKRPNYSTNLLLVVDFIFPVYLILKLIIKFNFNVN